ncbi:hypothetical protein NPX13_g7629 [Xylaria arbuscula]|uniref:Uncharacterized protein n=1 Tax=Xylaria arbuscula TaxID=114810 RepID=A0A9W8NAB3_9PEZI|nr:hypothetical protein NPX13_g7629 [Xylaria arbuscula]
MNPNFYAMAGTSASQNTPYELATGTSIGAHILGVEEKQLVTYACDHEIEPAVLPQWPQSPASRPPYREVMAIGNALDPNCQFRSEVLDDCAKARFYARMLELYVFDNRYHNGQVRCPLAACPKEYDNPLEMLQHLKHCKNFTDGKYWCPTCGRYESFRVRSGKRCSWDKDHLGRKFIQAGKCIFHGLGNNQPETQQTSVCPVCSAQFWDVSALGNNRDPITPAHQQVPSSPPMIRQDQSLEMRDDQRFYEADSTPPASELSGESSCESSPLEVWPGIGCMPPRSVSEFSVMSEMSTVSAGPSVNSITSGVSPSSFTHAEMPSVVRHLKSASIRKKVDRRTTGSYGGVGAHRHILSPHSAGLQTNVSTGNDLQTLDSVDNASVLGGVASSTLPSTFGQYTSSCTMPKLRLDTAQATFNLAQISGLPLQEDQQLYRSTTTRNHHIISVPQTVGNMERDETSLFDTFDSEAPVSEMQSNPPTPSPSLIADMSTPDSMSDGQYEAASEESSQDFQPISLEATSQ